MVKHSKDFRIKETVLSEVSPNAIAISQPNEAAQLAIHNHKVIEEKRFAPNSGFYAGEGKKEVTFYTSVRSLYQR